MKDEKDDSLENDQFDLRLVTRATRQEDTQRALELIPGLDVFVAASHERTNYAVGLGLPMFVLFPLIGTFASQNFEFAQRQGVVSSLDSPLKAKELGNALSDMRQDGELSRMAERGFGLHDISGIHVAASHFIALRNL